MEPIIDSSVRELVARIEAETEIGPRLDSLLRELVTRLRSRCELAAVRERYAAYSAAPSVWQPLPVDTEGYVQSFDALSEESAFFASWRDYGIVAGKQVVSQTLSRAAVERVHELTRLISGGRCDLARAETWTNMPCDADGTPLLSRGFFEIYHDDMLAQLRQSVRLYLQFVLIWGRADLWTSFDRLGVKLPGHGESAALPLHVDQNPNVHPDFRTVQGVLALSDCPLERGTYVGVPGSKRYFAEYAKMARNKGEYVELELCDPIAPRLQAAAQACPLRAGDLICWDSRTTHSNSANVSNDTRVVAYIACGPAAPANATALAARAAALRTGMGSNVREALMHASKKRRFTDAEAIARVRASERLTLLGRLLYGTASYCEID